MPAAAVSEQDIRNFFGAYNRDFNGLCEATMFQVVDRFGMPENPPAFSTAVRAGNASQPLSPLNPDAVGWFAHWGPPTGGAAGHTALIMPGRRFLMGSSRVPDKIGGQSRNVGFIPIDQYTMAGFRGISPHSGGRTINIVHQTPLPAGQAQDWEWWEPSGELSLRVMRALKKKGRYSGQLTPGFGPLARKGIQTTLSVSGIFKGSIDGAPARGAAFGVQQYAAKYGSYTGKIDGKPRENSWAGFALGLERP